MTQRDELILLMDAWQRFDPEQDVENLLDALLDHLITKTLVTSQADLKRLEKNAQQPKSKLMY